MNKFTKWLIVALLVGLTSSLAAQWLYAHIKEKDDK